MDLSWERESKKHLAEPIMWILGGSEEVYESIPVEKKHEFSSFLEVISPVFLGLKTFIFHGFGVQR